MSLCKNAVVGNLSVNEQVGGIPIVRSTTSQAGMEERIWGNEATAGMGIFFSRWEATFGYWIPGQFDQKILGRCLSCILKDDLYLPRKFGFIAWRDLADSYPSSFFELAVPLGLFVGSISGAPESYGGERVNTEN